MRKALLAVGIVGVLSLGAGSAVATARVAGDNAAATMHDRMSSTGMGSMMGSVDMDAMHAQMRDAMPAESRAACDAAHAAMNTDHAAHHRR